MPSEANAATAARLWRQRGATLFMGKYSISWPGAKRESKLHERPISNNEVVFQNPQFFAEVFVQMHLVFR